MTEYISLGSNCSIAYQLNKRGLRSISYPFDWVSISIGQLNNILQMDFDNFSETLQPIKKSNSHEYFDFVGYDGSNGLDDSDDNKTPKKSGTIILTNKYGIKFAHEITEIVEIDKFKLKISNRINRFRNLILLNKQICFIRIELNTIRKNWIKHIENLIKTLKNYIGQFKLILIINPNDICFNDICFDDLPEFVKIYKFENFLPDWKMDLINWDEIFSL